MRESARFWRDPDLNGLELLRATFVTHAFGKHTHDTFALAVIEQGAMTFRYHGTDRAASAGDMLLINPDEVHTGRAATADGYTYRIFYPDPALLQNVAADIAARQRDVPFFPDPVVRDAPVATLLRQWHRALEIPTPRLERESRLLGVLAALIGRHADDRPLQRVAGAEVQAIRRARDYLDAYADQNVSLAELAEVAQLSPYHLTRVFQAEVGLPPHAYLDQVRVVRAKHLLSSSEPIAQVATATGFVDQSHLTRRFKRLVGITPGQYRAASKNVQDETSSPA